MFTLLTLEIGVGKLFGAKTTCKFSWYIIQVTYGEAHFILHMNVRFKSIVKSFGYFLMKEEVWQGMGLLQLIELNLLYVQIIKVLSEVIRVHISM